MKVAKLAGPKGTGSLAPERLRAMGLIGVQNMNPRARTPMMEPDGDKRPTVLVLGDAPGPEDDEEGIPFTGESGQFLRRALPRELKESIRFDYCVRTLPPLRGKSHAPSQVEVECFRTTVEADVAKAKPRIIIGLGRTPLRWAVGEDRASSEIVRGRRYPVRVGGHVCWYYPILEPWFVYRLSKDPKARHNDIPGSEWVKVFDRDLQRIVEDLEDGLEEPKVVDTATLDKGTILEKTDWKVVVWHLKAASKSTKPTGIDIETNRKRPYHKGAKVLTAAVSYVGDDDAVHTIAFPLDHPGSTITPEGRAAVLAAFKVYCLSKADKVAHNLAFEMEWLAWLFGTELMWTGKWHDTMLQAYVLDERLGGLSLNFACLVHLGLDLKATSTTSTAGSWFGLAVSGPVEGIDRSNLEFTPLEDVMRYNGRDAKYTRPLFHRQRQEIKASELVRAYKRQLRRIPTIVAAQMAGMAVDHTHVSKLSQELQLKKDAALKTVQAQPEVLEYQRRYGTFEIGKPQHNLRLFRDVMGQSEIKKKGGGFTTDKQALALITDTPVAGAILAWRSVDKLKSTYVDALDKRTKDTVICEDGKIHPSFNTTRTDTGRLSANDPSVQNFPKRMNAEIRAMIYAPKGFIMVSADYAQIEARVIAMMSRDKFLVKALWEDYDVHMEWAERIAAAHKPCLKAAGNLKTLRSLVKNKWVFPAYYGSYVTSLARDLDLPLETAQRLLKEFWRQQEGVKVWQEQLLTTYNETGYVECLTGRRRRAPMSLNMVINTGVQGTASDIVVDAMDRLAEAAHRENSRHLAPILNVHDDLTFYVEKAHLEARIDRIVREMCSVEFPWVNVPIGIEVGTGPNWHEIQEIGKFRSDRLTKGPVYRLVKRA